MTTIKSYGIFTSYDKDVPDHLKSLNIIFKKNTEGLDWYEHFAHNKSLPNGLTLFVDSANIVISASQDAERLMPPENTMVYRIEDWSGTNPESLLRKTFDPVTGAFTETKIRVESITPLQARRGARKLWGITEQMRLDFLATLPPEEAEDAAEAWEYGLAVDRNNTFILAVAKFFNKTEAEVDSFFEISSTY